LKSRKTDKLSAWIGTDSIKILQVQETRNKWLLAALLLNFSLIAKNKSKRRRKYY